MNLLKNNKTKSNNLLGKNLILAGGENSEEPWAGELYAKFVEFAGGKNANIGIITAASNPNTAEEKGQFYVDLFSKYGCKVKWIPITLKNIKDNSNPDIVEIIKSMSGFFFGGGDQSNLTKCFKIDGYKDSPVLATIRNSFSKYKAVIAGTSAGAVIQSKAPMITGDNSYDINGGFGFFPYGLIDSHFRQRNREERLISLARKTKTENAYGIDENTTLIVKNVDTLEVAMEVLGKHQIHIFKISDKTYDVISIRAGDKYYPLTKQLVKIKF